MSMNTVYAVAIIIVMTYLLLRVASIIFKRMSLKSNALHLKFTYSCVKATIIIIGLSLIGAQFPATAEISKVLLQSTSLFVAVAGFAAQSVLADVISGMMISFSKPFNIGDRVTLKTSGITGLVEDITIRHTVIKTFYNSRLVIPNSIINKEILENSDYSGDYIGNLIEIGISYESDIDKAIEIMADTIENNELTLDIREDKTVGQAVNVQVKELGVSAVILKAVVWTKDTNDNFTACSEIRKSIKENFDAAGIEIPYNKLDVSLRDFHNSI